MQYRLSGSIRRTGSQKMTRIVGANRTHYGVVLGVSPDRFDEGAATFSSVYVDPDDPDTIFMFYSGSKDVAWSHSAIGLATSTNFLKFQKTTGNPVLEGGRDSFFSREALTPAVTRIGNRFFMVFSGRPSSDSFRRLGLAWADDPRGPWNPIMELPKRFSLWENGHLESGPSLVKLDSDTILVFYSNTSSAGLDIANFFKRLVFQGEFSPACIDVPTILRRYLVRRLGVLKLRIHGTSKADVEVRRFPSNLLRRLNGPKGSWNESLFCPGYFNLHGMHFLVPATSVYSDRGSFWRCIGMVTSASPYFEGPALSFEKLIDGRSEKNQIMPDIKGEISLDSPSPLLSENNRLFIYYSVMDSSTLVWKTAATSFNMREE